jgi:hypothetical protein
LYKAAPKNLGKGGKLLRFLGRSPGWIGKTLALPLAATMGGYSLFDSLTGAEDKGISNFAADLAKQTGGVRVNPIQNLIRTMQDNPYASNLVTGGLTGATLGGLASLITGNGFLPGAAIGGIGGAGLNYAMGGDNLVGNNLFNSLGQLASKINYNPNA